VVKGNASHKHKLGELGMEMGNCTVRGSNLVVAEEESRKGGGCGFPSPMPVCTKILHSKDHRNHFQTKGGPTKSFDKLAGIFISVWRADIDAFQNSSGSFSTAQ